MQPENNDTLLGYTPNMAGATVVVPEEEKPEEEKVKKPIGWIVAVAILGVLTLGFGIYMIADLLAGAPKCPECEVCADPELSKVEVLDFYYDGTAVLYQGEVYVNIDGTSTELNAIYGKGTWDVLAGVRKNYKSYEFGDSEVKINNEAFTGMKLEAKNVQGIFDFETGQALTEDYGLILLYKDGTLGYAPLSDLIMGETEAKPVDGVTEIINVISRQEFSGVNTYAITSSGNEVRLSLYIPEEK